MPMYEWGCDRCGQIATAIRNASEYEVPPDIDEQKDLRVCKDAGGTEFPEHLPLRRLISRSSFQLVGGGWYGRPW